MDYSNQSNGKIVIVIIAMKKDIYSLADLDELIHQSAWVLLISMLGGAHPKLRKH